MRVLLTGFEPYGGRGRNPSAEIVHSLGGSHIAGHEIIGHTLPVAFAPLEQKVRQLLEDINPALVVNLGLAPGTPFIRLERVAVNNADFEIPDNEGALCSDQAIVAKGPAALMATLPLRLIERRLLQDGIPVQLSDSAGAYLCNAIMYQCLSVLAQQDKNTPSGFIHLPYLPEQVADLIAGTQESRSIELHQRSDLASMSLDVMIKAVRLAIETSLQQISGVS